MMAAITTVAQTREIKYNEFDLPNGLHVILHEDHSTPIVAVGVMYHVGSKDEGEQPPRLRALLRAPAFRRLGQHRPRGIRQVCGEGGGVLNANTTSDRTYYYEVLPSNQLDLGLWLESERMMHAKVETKGIETQRAVVKEERRQRYENQPYGTIIPEVLKRAYTVHPYQWPTIGYMEDLNAATEADYKNFYKTFYVPNNAVLVLSGDFKAKDAEKEIKKYFADIPNGGVIPRNKIVGAPDERRGARHGVRQDPTACGC